MVKTPKIKGAVLGPPCLDVPDSDRTDGLESLSALPCEPLTPACIEITH